MTLQEHVAGEQEAVLCTSRQDMRALQEVLASRDQELQVCFACLSEPQAPTTKWHFHLCPAASLTEHCPICHRKGPKYQALDAFVNEKWDAFFIPNPNFAGKTCPLPWAITHHGEKHTNPPTHTQEASGVGPPKGIQCWCDSAKLWALCWANNTLKHHCASNQTVLPGDLE